MVSEAAADGGWGAVAAPRAGSVCDGASAVTTGTRPSGAAGTRASGAAGSAPGEAGVCAVDASAAASSDGTVLVTGALAVLAGAGGVCSPGKAVSQVGLDGVLTSTATGVEGRIPAATSASGITGAVNCDATARPRPATTPPQTMPPRNPRLKPYPPASFCCVAPDLFAHLAKLYTDPPARVNPKSRATGPDHPFCQKFSTPPTDNPASPPQHPCPAMPCHAPSHRGRDSRSYCAGPARPNGPPDHTLSRGLHGAADRR
jgi:hypothetical protein